MRTEDIFFVFYTLSYNIFIASNGLGVFDFKYELLLHQQFILNHLSLNGRFVCNKQDVVGNYNI